MATHSHALEPRRWTGAAAIMLSMACGPAGPATTSASTGEMTSDDPSTGPLPVTSSSTTSGGSSPTTSEASGTGTTESLEPCSEVHEGDLWVGENTDLASLANLGRVTGTLEIFMGSRDQQDLSFLPCLHTADAGIDIKYNQHLESTRGLVNLKDIGNLSIEQNPHLREIVGFEQIEALGLFVLRSNHSLEELHFDSLHTVNFMEIGLCMLEKPSAFHLALTNLKGFNSLAEVPTLIVDGNEALMSADLLDALASNGGPPPFSVQFRFNPLLPEALIHDKLDALGVPNRTVCGNLDGDPECFCPQDH